MSPLLAAILGAGVSGAGVALFLRGRWLREAREASSLKDQLARERSSRAESQAAENARQQALFENMLEGVLLVDASGRVQFTNTACRRFFYLEADVRGRTLLEAFRCNELSAVAVEAAKAGRVTLMGPEGRPDGVLMVLHDATRLRQLERTRREFVANVSHELRTPLSLIKGSVETLLDGAASQPAIASKFLDIIDRHCDRLTFLIEDLLTLSRLESGQLAINYDTVPLRGHVSEVFDDFRRKAEERGVQLINDVPSGLSARADSDRLDQVLSNLIDNAIKYGRPGGSVRIEGREVPGSDFVEMAVADDGPGIPTEAAERVFERFYRVDTARSREQGGTGLGLSIVKHIIQAHGGEVCLETAPAKGAAFRFTLPAVPPPVMGK
jgi:two-component system phosphate regulon sensor histidine kinase PhoR